MFKKLSVLIVLALIVSAISISSVQASDNATHKTFKGKLVCESCDLKQTEGARAACTVFGHKHALKTEDGQYVNFLENQYSKDLINTEKLHNATIKVSGTYFANAHTLDVQSFTVDGKKKAWCEHCSAMDGCMAGK